MSWVHDAAKKYNLTHSLAKPRDVQAGWNQHAMQQVANDYDAAKSNIHDPATQRAFAAYMNETGRQYAAALRNKMRFTYTTNPETYKNVGDLRDDVLKNRHLTVFTGGDPHPLITPQQNLMLRATHDIYGHARNAFDFSGPGELNSFRAHAQMYSPEAQKALASDLLGQAAHTTLYGGGQKFPEQKAALLPSEPWQDLLASL